MNYKKIMYILAAVIGMLFLVWIAYGYFSVRGVEEPVYKVLEKKNGYEVRAYEPYVVATVEVDGNQNQALNKGFTLLADYIFGNNTSKQKLAMTTPVKEAASEKIAMTAPVLEQAGNTTAPHEISFVMPVSSTLETLPKPNNPAVKLRQIPARKVAVLKYTWLTPESRVENKKKQLQELLKKDGVTTLGTPEAAFYNPPFTPPFMRRNEILIPIN
jgi:hypothetical protein